MKKNIDLENTTTKFPNQIEESYSPNTSVNPYLDEIYDVYEKGFESLNIPGFDFFELYKSVLAVGAKEKLKDTFGLLYESENENFGIITKDI